ncbi:MAG: hypothetical protein GY768_20355 [Planctomycetaceae bacterium]|nr:hypothetical protein [Planctomycetaceae bacterium]
MIKQTLALALGKSQTRRDHRLARRLGHYEWLEDRRVLASLSGHVINDLNGNGQIEVGEPGLGGVEVFLDQNGNDMLDITGLIVEPDAFDSTELIDTSGVTLSVQNQAGTITSDEIIAIGKAAADSAPGDFASTGDFVFGTYRPGSNGGRDSITDFFNFNQKLRMAFADGASSVSIDVIGSGTTAADFGVLEIYDGSNNLLASATTQGLCVSDFCETQIETLRLERAEGDISYALAYTERVRLTARFDSLRVNDAGSEPWTITNTQGDYEFRNVAAGTYRINQVVPTGYQQTLPNGEGDGSHEVLVEQNNVENIDFANVETVTAPPVARDDSATTPINSPVTIDILANDGDANTELDPSSVEVILSPSSGLTEVDNVSGEVTYTPINDLMGSDSFRYTVRDTNGQLSNEAVVLIEVTDTGAGWQNPENRFDVNADKSISPMDVLKIINELNRPVYHDPSSGALPNAPTPIPAYFDVNGDRFISPNDAIQIINVLNENPVAAIPANPTALAGQVSNGIASAISGREELKSQLAMNTQAQNSTNFSSDATSQHVALVAPSEAEKLFDLETAQNIDADEQTFNELDLDDATTYILARNAASMFI